MTKKYVCFLFSAILGLSACNKKSEDGSKVSKAPFYPVNEAFFSDSDFSMTHADSTLAAGVESRLYELDKLWNNYQDGSEGESYMHCYSDFKFKIKSSDTLFVGGEQDLASCMATDIGSSQVKVNKVNLKLYMEFQCVGVDLRSFAGRSLNSAWDSELETACGTATVSSLSNQKLTIEMSGNGQTFSTENKDARMTSSGGLCSRTYSAPNWSQGDGCTDYTSYSNGMVNEVSKVSFNNLVASNNKTDAFFVSGIANVTMGEWTGTVTYNGVNSAASYSMTDGNETLTGTLTPVPPSTSLAVPRFKKFSLIH